MVPRQLQPGSEAGLGPWSRLRLCHEELQILDGQAETEVTETQSQTELKVFFALPLMITKIMLLV